MYVSATDREKLGQVTTSAYTLSTEEKYWLFCCLCMQRSVACQCIVFILHLFETLLEYLTMDGEYNSSESDQN